MIAAAVLLVVGTYRAMKTPLDVFPEFAPPLVEVQVEAPGLSSEAVEQLITLPLEAALNGLPRMTTLRSGTVASGGAIFQGAEPAKIEAFMAAAGAGGYLHDVGKAISPQTTAQALLSLLAMPRDAHIDFIAVRAS